MQSANFKLEIDAAELELRGRLQAIALGEMQRGRQRLGLMTTEQERAVEDVLLTAVERISNPIVQRARHCYALGEVDKARKWCSIFG